MFALAQIRLFRRFAAALVLLAFAGSVGARALQRVTLQNGFSYDCSRQEALDAGHVRLFLLSAKPEAVTIPSAAANYSAGANYSAAANYIDVPVAAVASVETLPDPPAASATAPGLHPSLNGSREAPIDLHSLLQVAGSAHDIDVELLASIVHAESGGRAGAISRVGAVGLMQLMPATALSLGIPDARLPEGNINGGTAYLDFLLRRYKNDLALALAAYNAGPGTVDRYHGIPPFRETRAYVARVMTEFKRRKLELNRVALAVPAQRAAR